MNRVIGENEKCVFYFMEKLNGLFGQSIYGHKVCAFYLKW